MKARGSTSPADAIETAAAAWVIRRDAGLTPAEQAEFDGWRDADPRHATALASHEQAWGVLDRPRAAGEGEFMRREYEARIIRRHARRLRRVVVCGAILLLAGAALWRSRPGRDASSTAGTASIVVPTRQVLADGSRVELKSGAEIAVAFEPEVRRVALQRGEAHFEIASNAARPFVVRAAGVEVAAVGTAFSVQIGSREITVLVTEGRVAIARGQGDSQSVAPVLVDAGHRVVVPVGSFAESPLAVSAISPAELDERLAWRKAHLEFSDTPLGEAVELLNRYAADYGDTRLAIGDPAVSAVLVSGYFRADNLEAFVRLIAASAGIESERTGSTITLRTLR